MPVDKSKYHCDNHESGGERCLYGQCEFCEEHFGPPKREYKRKLKAAKIRPKKKQLDLFQE